MDHGAPLRGNDAAANKGTPRGVHLGGPDKGGIGASFAEQTGSQRTKANRPCPNENRNGKTSSTGARRRRPKGRL